MDDVQSRIKPGLTELMQAGGLGEIAKLRRLVAMGEDVSAADDTGWTALMVAAVAVKPESVAALLDAGARMDQRDAHGDTALIGAAAVRFGKTYIAAELVKDLLSRGAEVDLANQLGETALMWAARRGNPKCVEVLLEAGADPKRRDQSGHDALWAARTARESVTFDPALVDRYEKTLARLERK